MTHQYKLALYEDDEPLDKVILDPSLLVPPAHLLLDNIMLDSDVNIVMTDRMKRLLFPEDQLHHDQFINLLQLIGATKDEASFGQTWLNRYRGSPKFIIIEPEESLAEFQAKHLIDKINEITANNDIITGFIADEISLALRYPDVVPILCSETSSFWLADRLREFGAKIKTKVIEHGRSKRSLFRSKKFWKKALATTAGAGFLWMWGGPLAGLGTLGVAGIHGIIEDP
jgi:hypothetical protein